MDFLARLESRGLSARGAVQGTLLPPVYRVYLAPFSSRDIASLRLEALQQAINDNGENIESFLITRGQLENGIAFGVFDTQAEATALADRLRTMGFDAQTGPVPQAEGVIFVQLSEVENQRISGSLWQELTLERPQIGRSENVCETIAQANQFP